MTDGAAGAAADEGEVSSEDDNGLLSPPRDTAGIADRLRTELGGEY